MLLLKDSGTVSIAQQKKISKSGVIGKTSADTGLAHVI